MQEESVQVASWRPGTYVLLIVGIAAAAFFGIFNIANQLVGPASQERQRAVAVIRSESNFLAAYTDTHPAQVIVRDEPFTPPVLLSNYGSTDTCQDIQGYYASLAPGAGWRPHGALRIYHDPRHPNDASQDLLHSEYTENVQSISLTMIIECYPAEQGYSLDISHDEMQTPMPNLVVVLGVAGAVLLIALPLTERWHHRRGHK